MLLSGPLMICIYYTIFRSLLTDYNLPVGIMQALMIGLKSLLLQFLQEKDHKEAMAENSAVLVLLNQMTRSLLRALPGLRPSLRLSGHIEKPLDPADN